MKTFKSVKTELLKDKKVKEAYDELGPEFEFIQTLIEKRIGHGMTQAALAKKVGTKQSAISRLESGTYNPSVDFLKKVADALEANLKVTLT
ncbi:MAG: helix-turn-helix transcriptional regulator [Candidatus Uhrbacteria bacterium]|nr:helix-turn-helix transcriptional regulator [Patescibacteria group bacterium]MBU1906999.1 helix-turn-helix transcriptional regulator [Patescibacteria group bacterium]